MKSETGLLLVAAAVVAFVLFKNSSAATSTVTNSGSTLPSNTSGLTNQPVTSLGTPSTAYIGSNPVSNFDSGGDPASGDSNANASMYDMGTAS